MKNYPVFFILLLFIALSCQVNSLAVKIPIENKHTFNASFEKTWGALTRAVSNHNYPFKIIERESGILHTDRLSISEDLARKYSTLTSSPGTVYQSGVVNINFLVQSNDTLTTVTILPSIRAVFMVYKVVANVYETHELPSNGVIEKNLFAEIGRELK